MLLILNHRLINHLRQELAVRNTQVEEARRRFELARHHEEWLEAEFELSLAIHNARYFARLLQGAERVLIESPEIILPTRATFSHAANGV